MHIARGEIAIDMAQGARGVFMRRAATKLSGPATSLRDLLLRTASGGKQARHRTDLPALSAFRGAAVWCEGPQQRVDEVAPLAKRGHDEQGEFQVATSTMSYARRNERVRMRAEGQSKIANPVGE